ncbi:hypothetical protein SKAU_G00016320 [Synaphobranchus kaupii]|uniref:Uncharacterized protein n=1 Tax=Synaphobranchus kaupii TaxID=118154 RepID=A0A9Q1GB17_SYNKA|nr:hypothetical protein SKAU_G00016320 [Synaphobranchus kaupii]
MYKQLQNMKSPRKRQGPVPQRGVAKKSLFRTESDTEDKTDGETSSSNASTTSTVILPSNDDLSDDNLIPVDSTIALLTALPSLFPSPNPPPKRLGNASEALLHILQPREDPSMYLEKRPLSSPVLLFEGTACILAVENIPVSTLPTESFFEGMFVTIPGKVWT